MNAFILVITVIASGWGGDAANRVPEQVEVVPVPFASLQDCKNAGEIYTTGKKMVKYDCLPLHRQ